MRASCQPLPNTKLSSVAAAFMVYLSPCFSLPIFQAHPPTALTSPTCSFVWASLRQDGSLEGKEQPLGGGGLSNRGSGWGSSPPGWGTRTLLKASKRRQSARAKVTLLHSPRLCCSVSFYKFCRVIPINQERRRSQEFFSCAPHHDC